MKCCRTATSAVPTTRTAMRRSSTAWAAAVAGLVVRTWEISLAISSAIFLAVAPPVRAARRGADVGYVLELDLEEAVAGIERRIEIPTLIECEPCHGSGSEDGKVEVCATCHGRGQVRIQRGIFAMQQSCPHCDGRGTLIQNSARPAMAQVAWKRTRYCRSRCRQAWTPATASVWQARAKLARPVRRRAICMWKRVREHAIFQRDGDDLHCEVPIRISQAALGDTVRVATLGGEAEIRIPAETQTGKLFRLRGRACARCAAAARAICTAAWWWKRRSTSRPISANCSSSLRPRSPVRTRASIRPSRRPSSME